MTNGIREYKVNSKPLWQSTTVWGAIITLIAVVCGMFGYEVTATEQQELTNQVLELVSAIGGLVGFITVLVGRFRAKQPVRLI